MRETQSKVPSLSSYLRDFPLDPASSGDETGETAFPVGGHCRAAFQSAHKKEYGYLRVSWAVAPSVISGLMGPDALPSSVSSSINLWAGTQIGKMKSLTCS